MLMSLMVNRTAQHYPMVQSIRRTLRTAGVHSVQ